MALFQPMQQGPSGSAVTPKAEVQDTSVNSILGFVEKAGTGLAGMFQDQAKSRSQQAVGTALTAFIDEQSRIAEAAEQGLDPAQARTRMRAAFNKHAANNPLLLDEFLKVQKAYAESQMGEAVTKGSIAYQEEQAQKQALTQQAAQDGFSDVAAWQNWEGQKRAWEAQDEFRKQKLYEARLEAQKASTDASKRSAALSKARELEIETKLSHNQGLRTDLAGQLAGAQSTVEGIINMPSTVEQKLQMLQQSGGQLKARIAGTYSFADQANITMAMTQVDMIQKYAEDAIVQGKKSQALDNSFSIMTKERAIEMIGSDNQFKNMATMSSIFGQSFNTILGSAPNEVAKKMVDLVVPPKEMKTPPPMLDKDSSATLDKTLRDQARTTDSPEYQVPKKDVLENQVVNALRSMTLYGDGYSSEEDMAATSKMVYGGAYEALKSEGGFNVPDEVQGKYKQLVLRNYEEAMLDIKNEYLDAAVTSYKTVGGGIGQSVETEQQPSTKVITPTVENGVFKFVATDPSAGAETARLNKTLAPAINNLAKMIAVGNGDPDLNKAIKELAPRLFEE